MAQCEVTGGRFAARITYTVQQDIPRNQSVLHVTKVEVKSLWEGASGACYLTGSIQIDGKQAAVLTLNSAGSCGFSLSSAYSGGGEGSWTGFQSVDVAVDHTADGTRSNVEFRVDLNVDRTNGTALNPGIGNSVRVELPRIPRASGILASPVTLGQTMTVILARQAERFRDTLVWSCGGSSGVIAQKAGTTQLSWTPARELAVYAPDAAAVPVTLTVTTYDGDAAVGSGSITVSCPIPADMVPTAAVTVTDKTEYAAVHGGFIQNRSQARVRTAASGTYGSRVTQIRVRCGALEAVGADAAFALPDSGAVPITVTVTDSRGRRTAVQTQVTVLPYRNPAVTVLECFRCDEAGQSQPDGDYAKIVFSAEITPMENGSAAYFAEQRLRGGTYCRTLELAEYDGITHLIRGEVILSAGIDSSYDCRIYASDSFGTGESVTVLIPVAFVLLDTSRGTRAVGIGMRAKNAGKLSIGMDTDLNEHRIGNLSDPLSSTDAATKGYVDSQLRALAQALGVTF